MTSHRGHDKAIKLRRVSFGKRMIRYMIIVTNESSREQGKPSEIPLFLGTDVVNNCGNSDSKNLGRMHSKYSEDGLACKVYLPNGYQMKEIRGVADKAWFYSIHGLFRIAFSFYPRTELKILLHKMLSLWMARAEEPLLQKTLVIDDINNIIYENLISENTFESAKWCNCKEETIGMDTELQHPEATERTRESMDQEIQCALDLEINDYNETRYGTQYGALDYQIVPKESINSSSNSEWTATQGNANSSDCIAEIIETIKPRLLQVYKDELGRSLIVPYIKSFLDLMVDEEKNIVEQQSTSFPIKLIKDYMDAKYNQMGEAPQDHELAIHIVSSWVGDRFYLFKDIIKHNIDSFKQTHIDAISELPSPEEIVRTVYPSAMYSLIYLWIRGTGEDRQDDVEEAKRIRSICLLILELLNGSPITGLGHWIFSVI